MNAVANDPYSLNEIFLNEWVRSMSAISVLLFLDLIGLIVQHFVINLIVSLCYLLNFGYFALFIAAA